MSTENPVPKKRPGVGKRTQHGTTTTPPGPVIITPVTVRYTLIDTSKGQGDGVGVHGFSVHGFSCPILVLVVLGYL